MKRNNFYRFVFSKWFTITMCFIVLGGIFLFYSPRISASLKSLKPSTEMIEREVELTRDFNGIIATTAFKINYTQTTSEPHAVISGPKNIVEIIEVKISDGDLSFVYPPGISVSNPKITIDVYGPALNSFEAYTAAELNVLTPVDTPDNIKIECATSGEINFSESVKTNKNVRIMAATSASVKLTSVEALNIKLESYTAADIKTQNCFAKKTKCDAYTAGTIKINGGELGDVKAQAFTAGTINLAGNINSLHKDAFTGGSVKVKQ